MYVHNHALRQSAAVMRQWTRRAMPCSTCRRRSLGRTPYSRLPRESNACRVPATLAPFHRPRGSPAAAAMLTHSPSQRSPSLSLSSSSLHLHLRRLHFARAPPLLQHTVSASASRLCIRSFYPLPLVFVSASTLSSQVALAWPRCLSSSSSLLFSHLPSSSSSLLSPSRLTALPACIQP